MTCTGSSGQCTGFSRCQAAADLWHDEKISESVKLNHASVTGHELLIAAHINTTANKSGCGAAAEASPAFFNYSLWGFTKKKRETITAKSKVWELVFLDISNFILESYFGERRSIWLIQTLLKEHVHTNTHTPSLRQSPDTHTKPLLIHLPTYTEVLWNIKSERVHAFLLVIKWTYIRCLRKTVWWPLQ